jgi:uncharacterized protein (TIGR03435 family)
VIRSVAVLIALVTVSVAADPQGNPETRLAFEAATVKPAARDAIRNQVVPAGPNRLYIPSMTLTWLIYTAYGDGGFNTSMSVRGGPDWTNRTAFAVEGVAPGPATPRQLRLMLQTLLEERFALKLRNDTETYDMLALVLDRSDGTLGPKATKWDGTCPAVMPALVFPAPRRPLERVEGKLVAGPASETDDAGIAYCPTGYRAGGITAHGVTMFTVAELLSLPPGRAQLGKMTLDRTGLTGRYAMELDFLFPVNGPAAPAASTEFASPSLSTAVREQWGLRLVPSRGPLKVVVVESAQLPASN